MAVAEEVDVQVACEAEEGEEMREGFGRRRSVEGVGGIHDDDDHLKLLDLPANLLERKGDGRLRFARVRQVKSDEAGELRNECQHLGVVGRLDGIHLGTDRQALDMTPLARDDVRRKGKDTSGRRGTATEFNVLWSELASAGRALSF